MDFRKDIRTPLDLAMWRSSLAADIAERSTYGDPRNSKHIQQAKQMSEQSDALTSAVLYFFTEEMAEVASATMATLDEVDIYDLLPAKSGVMWHHQSDNSLIEADPNKCYMHGIFWHMRGDLVILEPIYRMSDFLKIKDSVQTNLNGSVLKEFKKTNGLSPQLGKGIGGDRLQLLEAGKRKANPEKYMDVGMLKVLCASFILMLSKSIPNTVNTPVAMPAQNKRRAFRDIVSVVNVRHIEHRVSNEHNGRKLAVRFIVGGHFRNQPFGRDGETRRIFIDPYIKGPIGAPMKQSRPVYKF